VIVARTKRALRDALAPHRPHARIGFVPTMGALHHGHVALFDAARAASDVVVASVFVNPTQFDDPADLTVYPRPEAQDAAMARQAGVDVLFEPAAEEVYPPGHATRVVVAGAAEGFEGASRPGHFDGVATVCLKLFHMVEPSAAYFGQKDAQQIAVVRQMTRDLDLNLALHVVPTVRDDDGLALSSRNARLSPAERAAALAIPRALGAALAAHGAGADPAAAARAALDDTGLGVEYVEVAQLGGVATLVVAARAGQIRLIDNVPLDDPALAGLAVPASHPLTG